MKVRAFFIDLGERMGTTFIIGFLTASLPGDHQVSLLQALAIGALAAVASFFTTLLIWFGALKKISNPYVDLIYRAAVTFGQTLLARVVAAGAISALAFDWNTALRISLVAAGSSLLKGLIGFLNPATLGASPILARSAVHLTAHQKRHRLPLVV
jgi:hypothetical protein